MKIAIHKSNDNANGSSGAIYDVFSKARNGVLLLLVTLVLAACSQQGLESGEPIITVYKSPDCGCCVKWVDYLKAHNFSVITKNVNNTQQIKSDFNVPTKMRTCHTATIGEYVLEGHVPAEAITRLISEKPEIKGLAVPGMPATSPGMGTSSGDDFNVYSFDDKGNYEFYQRG